MSPPGRRIRIDLSYDGTDFAGWQFQPGRRTVQGVVEEALARIDGDRAVRVRGAGRTDAGVHARTQVADCYLGSALDDASIGHALHCMLPSDVRPLGVRTVEHGFNSWRESLRKTYRYRLDLSRYGDPFAARFAWFHPYRMDLPRLRQALALLPGKRDWSGFAGSACTVANRVRELAEARYEQPANGEGWFVFTADGFLTHMVRNLVGTLVEVARHELPVDRVEAILSTGDRRLAGPTAPARGLCLWEVAYAERSAAVAERMIK